MLKRDGKYLSPNSKRLIITILVIISILVLVFLYYLVIQPILAVYVFPRDEHCGVNYYESLSYLEYENGKLFHEYINREDMLAPGQVVDFYHVDRKTADNPIYGKAFDVFSIDIATEDMVFAEYKLHAEENYTFNSEHGCYKLFLVGTSNTQNSKTITAEFIAFCDKDCIIRYILMTDVDPQSFVGHLGNGLILHTSLNWECV